MLEGILQQGLVSKHMTSVHIMLRYETKEQYEKAKFMLEENIRKMDMPLHVNMPEASSVDNYMYIEIHVDEEQLIHGFAEALEEMGLDFGLTVCAGCGTELKTEFEGQEVKTPYCDNPNCENSPMWGG